MSENSQLSQPAVAGNSIEEEQMRKLLGGCFEVTEMPLVENSIRMELPELEKFCRLNNSLPLFQLRVDIRTTGFISQPVEKPYLKFFTFWGNCCIYATKSIPKINPATQMEGGEIHA